MERDLFTLFKEYGLSEKEIQIYLFLVRKNELTAYKISKETKIHRSTCYDVLERLISKGFISQIEEGNKKVFSANNITNVIANLKDKETILTSIIPKIQRLEQKQDRYVKVLESPLSQKEFYNNLLSLIKQGKLTFVYLLSPGPSEGSKLSTNIFIERIINEAISKRLLNKIDYKAIWDSRFKDSDFFKTAKRLGENKFLNLPTHATTMIFNNHLAFLYTQEESNLIEIKNQFVSGEMKAYFEHLWKQAKL
ncbi:MAG: helix-turn-helix domain-containing protein [Nanoarchaeota archaeon]|nr:helix-turn-helix domain-containing protein [Nanoarchaeota archaeon]MBU1028366.1 helix-turn-helix domain-containing protein [Nanoarchaeota archaeon]